ncbi:MAG: cytochrome ubiquinol oxidase subunit I [Candidatus Micrarchaeota archaeon]|nr:cytochrome ubiquinol oxidase subunit I [Candidatus Micrarchaeota archaeon]
MLIVDFDRFLMGFSLGVHIPLASIGIALPVIILIAEYLGIRYADKNYKVMARRLAIVLVVLFGIGTASGMLVALNILLLWPKFMQLVAQVAILPFYLETFAFFMETIFLGIYIYSWNKFRNPYMHVLAGVPIAIGGFLSGGLITMVNAFMNTPVGFNIPNYIATGMLTNVDPLAVFNSPTAVIELLHVLSTSCFAAVFIFLAYMAFMLLKAQDEQKRTYYKRGLILLICLAIIFTLFALVTGIVSIATLVSVQPEKYAAIEGNINPQAFAPERIGGIPINNTLQYYIAIPYLQSILATGSPSGSVPGLSSYPQSTWPPLIVHLMFDIMVGTGFLVAGILALFVILQLLKKNPLDNAKMLRLLIVAGALAVIILEVGWVMAELGRQPWIIYNVMLVSDAANYSTSIVPITGAIFLFYLFVIPFTFIILRRIFKDRPLENELNSQ